MEPKVKRIIGVITASLMASSAIAADMPTRYANALSPQADSLAFEMARFMGAAKACRYTDGTNLNRVYWEPRIAAVVPQSSLVSFSNIVRARAVPTTQMMSGPDVALKCDDFLDATEDQFPSFAEAPTATPLCWSDVTDLNRCEGTGVDDILAGLDPLLEGY
jgi:hypothetical protein